MNNAGCCPIGSLSTLSKTHLHRSIRAPARLIGLLLLLSSFSTVRATEGYPELSRVFYDFEVAGYCGLVTNAVGRGFRLEANRLIERHALDRDTVSRLRGDAWQAAHAEWQNRGLGGFKNWCRTEGLAAAERFQNEAAGASR